ncbi:hypothetical protein NYR62_05335 [Actinobacillus genomosp. 1]|uniref:hypothetical protein n=1 Tax=Actinobacillus genomosp. 1 TaxID=254839 RepID=UPI0024429F78|nr:hypothetical protein [Actinobacillus genomosp. 1]WGE35064.1 hypothetical protein NYR62_05335 [Actinobacillus genomosp. 1]
MTNQHNETTSLPNFEQLKDENVQIALAEKAQKALYDTEENAQKTMQTINSFVDDYLINGRNQILEEWLIGRFSQYPEIWEDDAEKIETAQTIISTVESLVNNQVSLEEHLNKGKSLTNYLNKKIDKIAKENALQAEELAEQINADLEMANLAYTELYTGKAINLTPEETPTNSQLDRIRKMTKTLEMNANLNLAWWGAKSAGSRLWNAFTGEKNLSRSEELHKIIRSAVDSAENKGIQVAVSGGLIVSAKKGWVKGIFDNLEQLENTIERTREKFSRVINTVLNVAEGWNNVRLIDRIEQGTLQAVDFAAETAKFYTAKLATNVEQHATKFCASLGRKAGTWIGKKVALVNPVAGYVAGEIGGFLGEKAGEWVSEKVVKPITSTAKKVADKAIDVVADTAKTFISKGIEAVSSITDTIRESKFNPFNWF